jgi:hypothetical protein
VIAVYDYEFEGRGFTGNRLSVHGNSESGDNMSRFLNNAYWELRRHRDQRELFRCFVNPQRPSESVLYRDLRWGIVATYTLFATLFGAIGFGMLTGVLVSTWQRLRPRAAPKTPDTQSLATRANSAAGKIRKSGGAIGLPVLAVISVWWTIASLPLVIKLPELFANAGNPLVVVTLVFPAVNIVLLLAFVYQLISRFKLSHA